MAEDSKASPSFIVKVNGSRLAVEKEAQVKEIVINDSVDAPSSFSVLVNDTDGSWADDSQMEIGAVISISLGFKDDYTEIFKGEITGMSSKFVEGGGQNYLFKGHNKLHRLVRAKKTQAFTEMSPSDIIQQIASDAGLQADCDSLGSAAVFYMQRNMTDYDLIMDIAKSFNCNVWMEGDSMKVKVREGGGSEAAVIEWGKTIIEFQLELDTSQLVTEVEVRGWDAENLEAIVGSKTQSDISIKIDGSDVGGKLVNSKFGAHKTVVIDDSVPDQQAADKLALDLITENSFKYIVAKAKIKGDYNLTAHKVVAVQGLGDRFSGKYSIKNARHYLSVKSGYTTYLTLVRNAL